MRADLVAVQSFLRAHRRNATESDFAFAMSSQADAMVQKIAHCGIDAQEAGEVVDIISDGPWTSEQKSRLSNAVSSAMCQGSRLISKNSTQSMTSLEDYMTDSLWGALTQQGATEKWKLDAFSWHCASLGLSNPSEQSLKHMAAVFSLSTGGAEKVATMTPVQKLATLRDMKKVVQVAYRGMTIKPAKTGTFPRDPEDFKQMAPSVYENVFAREPPMASKMASTEISQAMHSWPVRVTNASISGAKARAPMATAHAGMDAFMSFLGPLMGMMASASSQSPAIQMLPGAPRQSMLGATSPQIASTPTLALTNDAHRGSAPASALASDASPRGSADREDCDVPSPFAENVDNLLEKAEAELRVKLETRRKKVEAEKKAAADTKQGESLPNLPCKSNGKAKAKGGSGKAKAKAKGKGKAQAKSRPSETSCKRGYVPSNREPVHYKCGKMYDTGSLIRVYRLPGDKNDKKIRYSDASSRKVAYLKGYDEIDSASMP